MGKNEVLACMVEEDAYKEIDTVLEENVICWSCSAMNKWILEVRFSTEKLASVERAIGYY